MAYRSTVREEKKRDTRRALIDAALAQFFAHGTEAPSLDAICADAGCTRGAFYVHFASREELIVAAMDKALVEFVQGILAAGEGADDAGFVDAFLAAIAADDPHVGASRLRYHHLLDACARYPAVRQRYLMLIDASRASLTARMAKRKVGAAAARAEVAILISMGLLASVDLTRPVDLGAIRGVIRELVKA